MRKHRIVSVVFFLLISTQWVVAENPSRQSPRKAYRMLYTGIEGAMPIGAHISWLKYRAAKQRIQGSMDERGSNPVYNTEEAVKGYTNRTVNVGGCSIAIANDFVRPGAGAGKSRENTVIIDGDVINAGQCD